MTAEHSAASGGYPLDVEHPAALDPVSQPVRLLLSHRFLGDFASAGVLLAVAVVLTLFMVVPVHAFTRGDWPTQFFPVYAYLGERLRAFDIPAWNPHQFAGAPFAGDPESGWMYVPAMLGYALLPAEAATAVYIGFHIAFSGLAIYALARLLGLGVAGSFIGGMSYAAAWVAPASMHLVIWYPVTLWLIVALVAVELVARQRSWSGRLWSWLLGAFAISQILGVWLGQASYYAMLAIGAWIAYRFVLMPERATPLRSRIDPFVLTALAVFGLGFGLAAAGLLPRLDAVAHSNLAGGEYDIASSWADVQTGFSPPEMLYELVGGYAGSLWWYTGAVAVTLGVAAPVVAWRWRPLPFFVVLAAVSLTLGLADPTPLHALFYAVLPRFAELHEHSPERALMLFGPSVALLAAATVTHLPRWDRSRVALAAVVLAPAALVVALAASPIAGGALLSRESIILAIAAAVLAVCIALAPTRRAGQTALAGLILLALWDPAGRILWNGFENEANLERSLRGSLAADPGPFLYANDAADFLRQATVAVPGRYAGYDPTLLHDPATIEIESPDIGYRGWGSLKNPIVHRLLVFNWGTWFGIDDVQGYNPIQPQRYVEYVDAMNGHRQEYHERDVYPAGLASPLLDLLNLRYLVVPADAPGRDDLAPLVAELPTVYEDRYVRILKNPEALPRAWLVHRARQVSSSEALALLATGTVDPREIALLEVSPPALEAAPPGSSEEAAILRREPDRLDLRVTAAAPALLVVSEVWDPGWTASVDDVGAPVLVADHAFRAIPVPAGEHLVSLRYDPLPLRAGLVVSLGTLALAVGAAAVVTHRERTNRFGRAESP